MRRTHTDPGLQPERTLLSWSRTLLLVLVVGGFFIRWVPYYGAAVLGLGTAAALAATGIWVGQRRRYRRADAGISAERYPPAVGGTLSLTLVVVGLGALALLMIL